MDKDRIKGKGKDITGRVQRQVGEWTGDEEAQAKGTAKQIKGKAQNTVGKIKDAVKKPNKPPEERPREETHREEEEDAA
jgi:uncharacterized protein YjbJ (UPF0337 family)